MQKEDGRVPEIINWYLDFLLFTFTDLGDLKVRQNG
jgi:hypothetical protein